MQHRFVVKLFAAAKAMGVHTALDTNGYYGDRLSDSDLEAFDLVLLDIKAWDPGTPSSSDRDGRRPDVDVCPPAGARRRPVWVRYVLVPGLTDDFAEIEQIAKFAADLGNVERVDVLPFHQMGKYKWHQLGIPYTLENVSPPDNDLVERACAVFRAAGLQAH